MGLVTPDDGERERVLAARAFVHKKCCPSGDHLSGPCRACPSGVGTLLALRHLDQHPRDAKGARRALHDVVCMSGCGPDSDHADRTQAKTVAALRRFRVHEHNQSIRETK